MLAIKIHHVLNFVLVFFASLREEFLRRAICKREIFFNEILPSRVSKSDIHTYIYSTLLYRFLFSYFRLIFSLLEIERERGREERENEWIFLNGWGGQEKILSFI